jgi:transketolase
MTDGGRSSFSGFRKAILEIVEQSNGVALVDCASRGEPPLVDPAVCARGNAVVTCGAEQDMALVSAGLALAGKHVFVSAAARPLAVARAYEQIRSAVAVPNLKVVLSSVHDGEILSGEGAFCQMNEDFALMRMLPNMAVLAPSDWQSAYALTKSLISRDGPAYIRLSFSETGDVYGDDEGEFLSGGGVLLTEGDGATICANGIMVKEALEAAKVLTAQGIAAEVIDCYSIKPLPVQMLLASVRRTGCCVVAEKHSAMGGLYGAVAECLCRNYNVPVRGVAVEDSFVQSGTPGEIQEYYGLTHREIVHNVVQAWSMRRR